MAAARVAGRRLRPPPAISSAAPRAAPPTSAPISTGARDNIVEAARLAFADAGRDPDADRRDAAPCSGSPAAMSAPTGSSSKRSCRSAQTRVESDALIALEGALGDGDGAIAILGTGTRLHGAHATAWRARSAAGASWSATRAAARASAATCCEETLLAHDGIRPASPLTDAVLAVFRDDPRDVVEFTHNGQARRLRRLRADGVRACREGRCGRRARSSRARSRRHRGVARRARPRRPASRSACSAGSPALRAAAVRRAIQALLQTPLQDALGGAVAMAVRAVRHGGGASHG